MSTSAPAPRAAVREISQHEALGFAMWLAIHSEMHAAWFVQDVKTWFLPPIAIDQFAVYFSDDKPFGFVTWARLDEAGETSWRNGQSGLRPGDWNAGDRLWFIDFIAPFGGVRRIASDLRRRMPDQRGWSLRRGLDGRVVKTSLWLGRASPNSLRS